MSSNWDDKDGVDMRADLSLTGGDKDLVIGGEPPINSYAPVDCTALDRELAAMPAKDREKVVKQLVKDAGAALEAWQARQLKPTADRHLTLTSAIEAKMLDITESLDIATFPSAQAKAVVSLLGQIAKAISYTAPTAAKASGLEAHANAQAVDPQGKGRVPLVMIGVKVTTAPKDSEPVVTVSQD